MNVSIVIPTYKRPQLLLKCLESLYLQRLSSLAYEIIVITDGPDEVTAEAVQGFATQHTKISIRCINTASKKGPAAARNMGWRNANGKLILFTDDDTLPDEDWIANYYKAFIKADRKELAFSGKTIVPVSAQPTDFEKNTAGLETAEFITANCACSKVALEKVGGFDEDFTMAWREDSDLHFKLMTNDISIEKVSDAIVVHPVRQATWGISIKEQKKSMFNALLYKKHPYLYQQKIGAKPIWNYYAIITLAIVFFVFVLLKWWLLTAVAGMTWLTLVAQFAIKRLKGASKQWRHISEMIYTSAIIPFLSVYWTLYGSIRYKKLLF